MKDWKLSIRYGLSIELVTCLPFSIVFMIPFYIIASTRGMGGFGLVLSILFFLLVNLIFTFIMIKKGELIELKNKEPSKNGKFIVLKDRFIKMDSIVEVKVIKFILFYKVIIEEEKYLKTRFYFKDEEEANSFVEKMDLKKLIKRK